MKCLLKKAQKFLSACFIIAFISFFSTSFVLSQDLDQEIQNILRLYSQPVLNRGDLANAIKWLTREIERRENKLSDPKGCELAQRSIAEFLRSEIKLSQALQDLQEEYSRILRNRIMTHLAPFDKLMEEYEELKSEAAQAGALVPDDVWQRYRAVRGNGVLFKEVLIDTKKDPGLISKISKFKQREYIIGEEWIKADGQYRKIIEKEVEIANRQWENELKGLIPLYEKYVNLRKNLEKLFKSRRYEHCLGEIGGPGLHYGSRFSDPVVTGTNINELPGMKYEFPSPEKVKQAFKSFSAPDPPGVPPTLHYYKDPKTTIENLSTRAKARLAGERYGFLAEAIEGPRYVCEVASAYAPWNMLRPLRHLSNFTEDPVNALYSVGKEYTWDNLMAVTKDACDLVEDLWDGSKAASTAFAEAIEGVVKSPDGAYNAITSVFKGANETLIKIQKACVGFSPDFDPKEPGFYASIDKWGRYINELNNRATDLKQANQQVKEAVRWYKEHVVDNVNRALNVALAIEGARAGFTSGGIKGMAKSVSGAEILDSLSGVKNVGKIAWERMSKRTELVNKAIRKSEAAQKILFESKEEGLRIDPKTREIAEEYTHFQKTLAKELKKSDLEQTMARIKEEVSQEVDKPVSLKKGKKIEVKDLNVKEDMIEMKAENGEVIRIPLDKRLGKGGGSEAYVYKKDKALVARITRNEKAYKHDEYGRGILEGEEFKDNRYVRVARREKVYRKPRDELGIDKEKHIEIVENLSEDRGFVDVSKLGELSKGQRLAIEMAHRELNSKGTVWLDNTSANYRLERLPGEDRWRVVILDPGGIYKVKGGAGAAREVQKVFNEKMEKAYQEVNKESGPMRQGMCEKKIEDINRTLKELEYKGKKIEFDMPEELQGENPAFAIRERVKTGWEGVIEPKLKEIWEAKKEEAIVQKLEENLEYQRQKQALEQAQKRSEMEARALKEGIDDALEAKNEKSSDVNDLLDEGESIEEMPGETLEYLRAKGDLALIKAKAMQEIKEPSLKGKQVEPKKTIKVVDKSGKVVELKLGELLGAGGGSKAYVAAKNDASVYRKTLVDSERGKIMRRHDEHGRKLIEEGDFKCVRVVKRKAVYKQKKSPGSGTTAYIEEVENLSDPKRFAEWKFGKPKLTEGQKLALEAAHRELNSKGIVWMDNTARNYRFERLPGEDNWKVVILDPGGLYKVKSAAKSAKKAQEIFDNLIHKEQVRLQKLHRELNEQGLGEKQKKEKFDSEYMQSHSKIIKELENEGVELELPQGTDCPAFAIIKRPLTEGLKGLSDQEILKRFEDMKEKAVEAKLKDNPEYVRLKEELKRYEETAKQVQKAINETLDRQRHIYLKSKKKRDVSDLLDEGESIEEIEDIQDDLLNIPGMGDTTVEFHKTNFNGNDMVF